MSDSPFVFVTPPRPDAIYIYSSTTATCRIVARKWWQFWKPRLTEEWTVWTDIEKEHGTNA